MIDKPLTLENLNQSNLNLLISLAVLLDEAHVSRAAERLGMTQSAISHVLNRARDLFDDPLLIKGSQNMILTSRAQTLKTQLNDFVLTSSTIFKGSEFDPSKIKGVIRFTMNDLAASLCIEEILTQVAERAPFLELEYVRQTDSVSSQLNSGKLDLAIGSFKKLPKNVSSVHVGFERWSLLVGQRYHDNNIETLAESLTLPQAKYAVAGEVDTQLEQFLLQHQLNIKPGFTSGSMVVLAEAMKTGYLTAIVPHTLAHALADNESLTQFDIPELSDTETMMVWPEDLNHQALHVWIRELIMTAYQNNVLCSKEADHAEL
ncbi:LysR family transcriptional regulator [Motilimonas sp. E26]|uniref:LysR family transcriptional regulator n=1 Tax=Motilimonas sp. E26 TaxID=2865674 RepID=UPI001E2E78C3|nr:LysR family transcriptional regulator [Motilimonas sp. E26]MCE0555702.1 LysR family transcriptional regulator [Motilimonas sp. E26]